MEDISKRLKAVRLDYGLSQVDFAKRLGITNAYISKIEKGKTIPSEALIRLICKEFKINELWLKNGEAPVYLEELEDRTENILTRSTQQFNRLLKTENAVVRAQAAQLNMLFSEIVNGDFSCDDDRLTYLKLCEKLLYDINSYLKFLKDYSLNYQLSFEPKEIKDILKDKKTDIISDLNKFESLYTQKN